MRIRRALILLGTLAVAAAGLVVVSSTASALPAVQLPLVGASELFIGNYDTSNFCQWATVQNKTTNSPACDYDQNFRGMKIVADGPAHPTAVRYEIRDGDIPAFGGGERAESRAGDVANVKEGDERWYQFSMKFGSSFPNPTGNYFVVMQWHPGDGSPPLALEVNRSGVLQVVNNRGAAPNRDIGPIKRGAWVNYVLHVKFSSSVSVGFAEVFQDGKLVTPRHSRVTMAGTSLYLKQGIYRDPVERSTATVWHDGLRITAP